MGASADLDGYQFSSGHWPLSEMKKSATEEDGCGQGGGLPGGALTRLDRNALCIGLQFR